jgi:hypothetical protein
MRKAYRLTRFLTVFLILALGSIPFSMASAQGDTVVRISGPNVVNPGEQFTVDIIVEPETAIAGMQFNLAFDPSLVTADIVDEGNLLSQNGATTYFTPGVIDNVAGTISAVAGVITTPGQSVAAPGTFATVTLTAATEGGTSPLTLSNVVAGDINGQPVTVSVVSGQVNINQAPLLNPIGARSGGEGELLTFTISATDADGDELFYSASNLPEGASFDAEESRVFSWTPSAEQVGSYSDVHFEVSDGLLTDSEDITITVEAASPDTPPSGGGGGGGGGSTGVTNVYYSVSSNGTFLEDVTAKSADGNVILYIPENTVGLNRNGQFLYSISIKESNTPPPPSDAKIIGQVYEIGPSGATFDPPIDLTCKYVDAEVPQGLAEKNLVLATYNQDTEQWQVLEGNVDIENNTVSTKLSHFSTYAVLAYTRPASFEVTEFSVAPEEVELGSDVNISALVSNTGDLTGSYEVSLELDDVVMQTREVALDGGDSVTVIFNVVPETAGEHKVGIGDSLATFTVKEPEAPADFTTSALNITPNEVSPGDSVTIAVLVSNNGDLSGSYEAVLKIDDAVVQTKEVTISGGDSEIISFSITPDTPGRYTVDVNGLAGTYEVQSPLPPAAIEASNPGPGIGSFDVTPIYDNETGKLVSARIDYQLNESQDLNPESELNLKVYYEGELLEELSLLAMSQWQPGENTVSAGYIPSLGWNPGLYTFQVELYGGDSSVQSTEQYQFTVTPESITRVVSWKTLGIVVGATLILVTVVVAIILYRRRDMLRDYIE